MSVVAIDFGTSYSGFAFSFNKGQEKDAIFMNKDWTNEQNSRTSKAPTCLLLDPDLTFHSFGYEAMENYAQLQNEEEEQKYFFFQHFKMALHSDTVGDSLLNTEVILIYNFRHCFWKKGFVENRGKSQLNILIEFRCVCALSCVGCFLFKNYT